MSTYALHLRVRDDRSGRSRVAARDAILRIVTGCDTLAALAGDDLTTRLMAEGFSLDQSMTVAEEIRD